MRRFFALLAIVGFCADAAAESRDVRTETVRFKAGQSGTSIKGRIVGYGSVSYLLGAEAGQTMSITLKPANLATYFNVYEPGKGPGDQALANSGMTGPMTPRHGEYLVRRSSESTLPARPDW
jgi:hypothetical protein